MNSLEALNSMKSDALKLQRQCDSHEKAQMELAALRKSKESLTKIINDLSKSNYSWDELKRSALFEVVNECKLDLIRLAELRLAAKARELKIKAAQRNAIVTASILPLPEVTP